MKKVARNEKLKTNALCFISEFEENEKKCVCFLYTCLQFLRLYSFTYTTYKPSHHNHSIIPLSNHHTKIIPKSFELRNTRLYLASRVRWLDEDDVARFMIRRLNVYVLIVMSIYSHLWLADILFVQVVACIWVKFYSIFWWWWRWRWYWARWWQRFSRRRSM